jgi:hypothetical protein
MHGETTHKLIKFNNNKICEFWGFNDSDVSSQGPMGCDAM